MDYDIARACARMEWICAEADIGYGQGTGTGGRWDIRDGGACDCSSAVAHSVNSGYGQVLLDWATYTGNLRPRLAALGWQAIPLPAGTTTPLQGDVLLWEGHHTAMCTRIDATIAEAWINELGGTLGGQPGDQTGQETRLTNAATHPYRARWDWLLRPPTTPQPTTDSQDIIDMATTDDIRTATRGAETIIIGTPRDDGGQDYWLITPATYTYGHIATMTQLGFFQALGYPTYERQAPGVLAGFKRVDA